jgi:aspartate/methionine/tyrosine aminotransferase
MVRKARFDTRRVPMNPMFGINALVAATAPPPIPAAAAWGELYAGNAGLINLAQAVPGDPPPPALLARLSQIAAGVEATGYGPIFGDTELRTALAKDINRIYGADCTTDDIAITAGCNQAFFVAMIGLCASGGEVIVPTPFYFNHKMTLDMLGIGTRLLPCEAADGYVPRVEAARALIGPDTRAIVLVTPNNPTGAVYPDAAIRAFHDLCAEAGIALILDETYRDFLPAGMELAHSLFAEADWRETLVHLYSFSKSYAVPGYRLGAIAASPDLLAEVAKVMDCLQICAPRVGQPAIAWAIDGLAAWRRDTRESINARADVLREVIAQVPGWSIASTGAYFAFVRYPSAEDDTVVAERLAREQGVVTLPGSFFGAPAGPEGHLRIAFANVGADSLRLLPERLRALRF